MSHSLNAFVSGGAGVVLRYFRDGSLAWGWRIPRDGDPVFPSAFHLGLSCSKSEACGTLALFREKLPREWRVILRASKRFDRAVYPFEIKVIFPPRTIGADARAGLRQAGMAL